MYALVESGSITKYFNYPKGFTLGDLQYSGDIFTKWTASELAAIGIYVRVLVKDTCELRCIDMR